MTTVDWYLNLKPQHNFTIIFPFRRYDFRIYLEVSLPPANEVRGKVIFLHLSVCSQGGLPRGGLHPGRSAYRGLPLGGSASSRVCLRGSASVGRGFASRELGRPPPHSGTRKAGGTHPTGMLSCGSMQVITA